MKKNVFFVLLLSIVALQSCTAIAYNGKVSSGLIYSSVSYPGNNSIDNSVKPLKVGKACATNLLGLFSFGEADLQAAKSNGNIVNVNSVDSESFSLLGIYASNCTLVYGQ